MRAMMVSRHCSKDSAPAQEEAGPWLKHAAAAPTRQQQQVGHQLHLPLQWSQTDTSLFRGCDEAPADGARLEPEKPPILGLLPALPLAIAPGGTGMPLGARTRRADAAPAAVDSLAKAAGASPAPSCHPPPRGRGHPQASEPRRRGAGPGATERKRLFG